ncbi:hypothetical protein BV898_16148 [Hypsibius exemplaris]|uniref:Uncharacterized protein n=1 Tax=Hypsibius exemplaris TaxID=2072580 RepID=A0A9X6NE97_HYPEX|nr:hypothetical protein BV898_16148 [Hypsibius exemplaris]
MDLDDGQISSCNVHTEPTEGEIEGLCNLGVPSGFWFTQAVSTGSGTDTDISDKASWCGPMSSDSPSIQTPSPPPPSLEEAMEATEGWNEPAPPLFNAAPCRLTLKDMRLHHYSRSFPLPTKEDAVVFLWSQFEPPHGLSLREARTILERRVESYH